MSSKLLQPSVHFGIDQRSVLGRDGVDAKIEDGKSHSAKRVSTSRGEHRHGLLQVHFKDVLMFSSSTIPNIGMAR